MTPSLHCTGYLLLNTFVQHEMWVRECGSRNVVLRPTSRLSHSSNCRLMLGCLYICVGYLADLNGSLLDDTTEFRWDFETSLNGNPQLHMLLTVFSH